MAEDEGKKEEENFDFTPEGEAVNYISLDRAGLLAVEYARGHVDFYGPNYADQELVWKVLSQDENEDYYDDASYDAGYVDGAESGDLNLDGGNDVLDVVLLVNNILNP